VLIFLFPRRIPFPPPRVTARSRPPLSCHYRGRMKKRKAKERGPVSVAAIPERTKYLRPRNSAAVASRRIPRKRDRARLAWHLAELAMVDSEMPFDSRE